MKFLATIVMSTFLISCGDSPTPETESQPSEIQSKQERTLTEVVDLRAIAGKSRAEVDQMLGEPSSTGSSSCSGVPTTTAQYQGGEIDIVFIDGKADWITVFETTHLPYSPRLLEAFNLPEETPSFRNFAVIRWERVGGFREVSAFPLQSGGVDYVLAIASTVRC